MRVVLLNGPDLAKGSVMIRSGDRWPHRIARRLVKEVYHSYPFWFAYAVATLKERLHEPIYIDSIIEGLTLEETVNRIRESKAGLVVIATSTPTIQADLTVARLVKESCSTHICLVDTHATVFHRQLVEDHPSIDSVVRGEFEVAVCDLADVLSGSSSLDSVTGLTYRAQDGIRVNDDRPLLADLDTLPHPDRAVVDQCRYKSALSGTDRCYMILSSRGCPFRCTFCLWVPVLFRNKVRMRSAAKVADEIIVLRDRYKAKEIFFHDDTMNLSVRRMEELCQEFINRKIDLPWIANMRADQGTREMYRLMRQAGCSKVLLGVETGCQKLLDAIDKKITLEDVRRSVLYAKEAGIQVHCTFLLGIPGETKATLRETASFIRALAPDDIQVSIMTPYPGTPYFESVKSLRSDWETFDGSLGSSFCELTSEELRNAVNWLYFRHYLSPRVLFQRIRRIKSWEEVRENWLRFKTFLGRYLASGVPRPM